MPDNDVIDHLINFKIESGGTDRCLDEDEHEVGIASTDKFSDMIMSIKMTVESMDMRISRLELDVDSLKEDKTKERPRNSASMPNPDGRRHAKSPHVHAQEAAEVRD